MASAEAHLVNLPQELLEKIFSYISFDQISHNRLVCRRINEVCQRLLNKGFIDVEKHHSKCLKEVKGRLPRRESERRKHPLARCCDILTAVETRLSLLNMTFMKYITMNLCCFIPGKVIDEIYYVLRVIHETEGLNRRPHEILQELRDISSMAMEHFDEKIAPALKFKIVLVNSSSTSSSSSSSRSSSSMSSVPHGEDTSLRILQNMKQMGSTVLHLKKDFIKYKNMVLDQRKKINDQDRAILEQNRVIAEQTSKLDNLEGKLAEINKKLLVYDQRLVDTLTDVSPPNVSSLTNAHSPNVEDKIANSTKSRLFNCISQSSRENPNVLLIKNSQSAFSNLNSSSSNMNEQRKGNIQSAKCSKHKSDNEICLIPSKRPCKFLPDDSNLSDVVKACASASYETADRPENFPDNSTSNPTKNS